DGRVLLGRQANLEVRQRQHVVDGCDHALGFQRRDDAVEEARAAPAAAADLLTWHAPAQRVLGVEARYLRADRFGGALVALAVNQEGGEGNVRRPIRADAPQAPLGQRGPGGLQRRALVELQ